MKVFHTKVFDGIITGTSSVYTHTAFSELLGSVERIGIGAQMNAVSGTGPTITVQIENSPDGTRWMNQSTLGPELTGANGTLVTGDNAVKWATNYQSTTLPIGNHVRMRIALGGTSPAGYLRLWVVGRSPAF
ncbi:MAG TPA: hypothetical protein VHC69_09320 [Polyangiaceae bacterium]|nr:hypothetical protein [Polyangiaceae bacterium]